MSSQPSAELVELREKYMALETEHGNLINHIQLADAEISRLNQLSQGASNGEEMARLQQANEVLSGELTKLQEEYDSMHLRFKSALDESDKKYDELLAERNSLTVKLGEAQRGASSGVPSYNAAKVDELNRTIEQLTSEMNETASHLKQAEQYIQEQSPVMEEAHNMREKHSEQELIITTLENDNRLLGEKLTQFEGLVHELEALKEENQKMTIIIREKDNTELPTNNRQIDEIEASLKNYITWYEDSQAKLNSSRTQVEELESHLRRAEEHIGYQEKLLQTAGASSNEGELHRANEQVKELLLQLENENRLRHECKSEVMQGSRRRQSWCRTTTDSTTHSSRPRTTSSPWRRK